MPGKAPRFRWFRRRLRLRRKEPVPVVTREPAPPSVVVACERCGFDYTVTRVDVGGGEIALVWTCNCGSRFIPPGAVPYFDLVRP